MKRAEAPGRVWSLFERATFWTLATLTIVVVAFLDRSPLIRVPFVADLIVLVLWATRLAVFGRGRRLGRSLAGVAGVAALVGGFGVVTGLWLDPLWSPTFTVAPVDAESIADLSRFRSCAGHDDSGPAVGSAGQTETDRSMAHHLSLVVHQGDGIEVVVRAMADGVITSVTSASGGEITLTMTGFSQFGHWDLRYSNVMPRVVAGTRVRAGDTIGVISSAVTTGGSMPPADGSTEVVVGHPLQFELALGYHPLIPFGVQRDSFVRHLSPALAVVFADAGFTVDEAVIPKVERDVQPCRGVFDADPDADWVFGDRARREA